MDRRELLLAGAGLALPFALGANPRPAPARPDAGGAAVAAARGVLERWIGARAAAFELLPLRGDPAQDAFEYAAHGGTVRVSGTSAIALARGAYEYLRLSLIHI